MAIDPKTLEAALAKIPDKCILVNAASRRAAELSRGARPLVPVSPQDELSYLDIALRELADERILVKIPED
ncbi:MAG: DNA-directed RNA polymerase subunit omega [Kiritimatiellaeota bacterium]|nr:DNA-directed RNA polymerase subunit omega [Kiritimatiellota bacterium]